VAAVAGSALAMFWPGALAFGYPGVLGARWQEMFGVGRGAVGSIMFFVLVSLGIFMFLVGRWQERYGTRLMMTVGGALTGLALLVVTFASGIWMVYLWGFLNGTASCFVYMPALTVVQRRYPRRRGLVSGIVNLVFGSAAALMSPLFALMLGSLGYRTMNLIVAALALVTGIVAARLASHPGLPPVSAAAPGSAPQTHEAGAPPVLAGLSVRQSLRTRNFWSIWCTWALLGAAGVAMVTLSVSYGRSLGFPSESAVVVLTAFNLTNGLSRIFAGYFSDRIRRTLTITITAGLAGAAYLLLPHVHGLPLVAFLAALVGLAFGTLFAVSAPLAVDCFGLAHFGPIFGLIFTAYGFIAGLLGPALSGFVLDVSGEDYLPAFTYLGALCLAAAVVIQFVKLRPSNRG
jgi:MFS transporter, OFA family, oxalate/formate antiporter